MSAMSNLDLKLKDIMSLRKPDLNEAEREYLKANHPVEWAIYATLIITREE